MVEACHGLTATWRGQPLKKDCGCPGWEDLVNQLKAASSKGQKDRRCKLNYSVDAHSASSDWKGALG